LVDYEVKAPNQVSVDFGGGVKVKFVSLDDATYDKLVRDPDTYASYETKKFTDPTRTFTSNDLFGGEAVVRVRQSVLESDRGLSAVLGHEYFEINGLAGRGAMQYGDINGAIDGLHNQAVNYGDNIVRQMINGGL
jgi:hypothetical protein